jgi:hypothetical protein
MSSDITRSEVPADLEGVARDASTITEVLGALEQAGFHGQFLTRDGATLECTACRTRFDASTATAHGLRRLEGASDPDDMLVVAALGCPSCATLGTVLLGFGPSSSVEEADVLAALDRAPAPSPDEVEQPDDH